ELMAGSSIIVAGSFTAGLILWTSRASYMMTVLSSSMPMWSTIDPIPVLDADACRRRESQEAAASESLVEIVSTNEPA
ncbi:MAG: hypothetical protein KDB23_12600, partial [Planctomycetales bacterium]|nr:hypothetical protein [Planctomycetales bacterium]